MSLTRTSLVTLSRALGQAARRKASTSAHQTFKSATAADEGYMFKLRTWGRCFELLPVVGVTVFAGAICAFSCGFALCKEELHLNPANKIAPVEKFAGPHRYKLINLHKDKQLPAEVQELKNELGPYYVR